MMLARDLAEFWTTDILPDTFPSIHPLESESLMQIPPQVSEAVTSLDQSDLLLLSCDGNAKISLLLLRLLMETPCRISISRSIRFVICILNPTLVSRRSH